MKTAFVWVENNDADTVKMFQEEGWGIVENFQEADLLCFTGGSDVSPALYGQENTHSQCEPQRDLWNVYRYLFAVKFSIPCVGICRGGQFLNVMNGGKMHQHYENDPYLHKMQTTQDGVIEVTSSHHQVMIPNFKRPDLFLEGWSSKFSDVYESLVYENLQTKPDFCYQPHPEWVGVEHECRRYFFNVIKKFLL